MIARRLIAATLAAVTVLSLAPVTPASATGAHIYANIAPAWGMGSLVLIRDAWTLRITGSIKDTRADGDCVYVEAVLEVDHWTDPDSRTPDMCKGKGNSSDVNLNLTPGRGSKLSRIRVRVCAADAFKDSCLEKIWTVPAERPTRPGMKAGIDYRMNMSMANFQRARAGRAAGYNWTADGCSSPTGDRPGGFNFLPACQRHDFGYGNYGKSFNKAAPYDSQRAWVDSKFLSDMRTQCKAYPAKLASCYSWAQTYYAAVRTEGGRAFYRYG